MSDSGYCLVIPHFNHLAALEKFLPKLLEVDLPWIVVDDGSTEQVKVKLRLLLSAITRCQLIEFDQNQGKGSAVMTGARLARDSGFTHMIQIDADGQHNVADIAPFIDYSKGHPAQIVSGAPTFGKDAPKARIYGRKITDFWVALETLSLGIKDSLCGFRVYPLEQFEQVLAQHRLGSRMDFDTEILVRSVWQGVQVHFIPTKVIYLKNSVSHFHYLRDNLSLIWLHVRLLTGTFLRLPRLIFWRLSGHTASVI